MSRNLKIHRIAWYAVLASLVFLGVLAYLLIGPPDSFGGRVPEAEDTDGGAVGGLTVNPVAVVLGLIGLVNAVAGARLGRAVFLPGWRDHSRLVRRLQASRGIAPRDPSLGVYLLGLALIESSAVIAVVLYAATGAFPAYILMTGIAMVGWVVLRPEDASGNSTNMTSDAAADDAAADRDSDDPGAQ